MEEARGIHEWELLHGPGGDSAAADAFLGIEGDSEGAIKSDYFALDSQNRYGRGAPPSDGDHEGDSLPDSENPSWVDPESDSRFAGEPSGGDPGGFWTSDESSDGQQTPPPVRVEGGSERSGGLRSEVDPQGVDSEDGEAQKGWSLGGIEGTNRVVEAGGPDTGDLGSGDDSPPRARAAPGSGEEDGHSGNHTVAGWGKLGMVWWKLPMEILKFCAFRIRPVWSISIAAALLGVVILGRRLYRRKLKFKSFPLKVTVDDKKLSQFKIQAARLNEAFSVVKRVPAVRSSLPTSAVIPWPVVALR